MDSAYLSTKGRNYIGFSEDTTTGFAERVGVVPSLLFAALILIVAFLFVLIGKFCSDKEKKA